MLKKEMRLFSFVLISIILLSMFSINIVFAEDEPVVDKTIQDGPVQGEVIPDEPISDEIIQEEIISDETKYDNTFNELEEEYEEEQVDPGITPDSAFYFLDGIFGDTREEKIAEVEAMITKGNIKSARKALLKYMEQAKKFEEDPDPEKRDEARRAAASIHRMLEKIKEIIPEDEREEFYDNVRNSEGEIITSVEISSKIKELCVQLAELDPLEYSKMCKTEGDAPDWQKKLDKDLTAEQEKIAKEFVNVMKQCFKTSGQDCACEEIPFYDFSIACSKAAPLAIACDVKGDEIACDELENLKMPELPEWLEPIWADLEMNMNEAQYDMHMPKECVEAGVTDPKDCGKVMIKTHAPLECKAALLKADINNEKEGKEICDKIMFELHSPKECIDKGITDPKECARFMDNFKGPEGFMDGKEGSGFGKDCTRIEDPTKRLECYDNKGNEMGDYYGPVGGEMPEGEITWQCKENRIHWPPDCEKFMREEWPEQEKMKMEEGDMRREQEGDWRVKEKECASKCDLDKEWWDYRNGECICYATGGTGSKSGDSKGGGESGCRDCSSKCPGASRTDCVNDKCKCYYDGDEYNDNEPDYNEPQYGPGEGPGEPGDYDNNGEPPSSGSSSGGDGGSSESSSSGGEGSSGGGDSGGSSESSDSGGDDGGESSDPGITGNVFLDYMNR